MSFESRVPLQHQSVLLETLHGRLPQGVAVLDADLRLVYANARWSSFLEHAVAAARVHEPSPGTLLADLLPGADDLYAAALRCMWTGETVYLSGRPSVTDAGETFWDFTLAPLIADELVTGLICIVDDATPRALAERAAAAKVRLAAFRADVSQALAGSDDIDTVLQSCAEAMVRHAPAAFARIWVLDEAEDIYRLRASAGLYTRLNGSYARIPADWIRRKSKDFPVYEPGMAIDLLRTHRVREPAWAAAQGLTAWASHPLVARGHVVGFMVMFARQNFDDDTLGELAAIADAIAQFIERKHAETALREREQEAHARLEQRVAERTRELSLLLEISRNVASTLELQPLLELILDQLKSVIDYTGTAVLTLDGDDLIIAGQRGPLSEEDARRIRYRVAGLAPVWDRLSRGEAITIHDVRDESLEARVFRAVVGEDLDDRHGFIRSCLWAPLVVKDQLIGLMSVTSREPHAFEPRQMEMAAAIARQAAVAIANARLHEQTGAMAALEERQRLSRDLHDAVSQTLFSANLIGDVLPRLWARNQQRGEEALEDLRLLTRGALAETRTLLFELRPNALVETPLGDLLRHLTAAVLGRARLPVDVTVEDVPVLPPDVQIAFYRIAQEVLNNVVKHAQARRVELHVTGTPDGALRLRIHDDGRGFDPNDTPAGHFGLQTMHERAAAIGAALTVTSGAGHGTDVLVVWPGDRRVAERDSTVEET